MEGVTSMRIALIGLGEVGQHFARDLRAAGVPHIRAFDILQAQPGSPPARALDQGLAQPAPDAAAAVADAELVFVAVTAGAALAAARSLAGALGHAPLVVDVNSVSPATKQAAAEAVGSAGGRYVEAAVMTSVPPHGIRAPMLLGGPHAKSFAELGAAFGMKLTPYSDRIGPASSVKMCRSVMIKGMEALTIECLLAARHYGVEKDVLRSLADTLPHQDWASLARYMISRSLLHGRRRAEELREVARTVEDAGIPPLMSAATAVRQDWAADQGQAMGRDAIATPELEALLDQLAEAARTNANTTA